MSSLNPTEVILEFLESHDLPFEQSNLNTFLITLPGEKKQQTHCALVIGDHSLSINAFVIRKPDENEDQVHAWCLQKNAGLYGIAFAINELRDIYLVGRLPLTAVTNQEIDRIIGSVLQVAASASPAADKRTSTKPVKRFFAFHSLSPWRNRINSKLLISQS